MMNTSIYANFNWNTPTNKFSEIKPQIEQLCKDVNVDLPESEQWEIIHARDALFDSILELEQQLDAMKHQRMIDITDKVTLNKPFDKCVVKYVRKSHVAIVYNIPCLLRALGNVYWSNKYTISFKLVYEHKNVLTQYIYVVDEPVINERKSIYPIIRLKMPIFCCDLNDDKSEYAQIDIVAKTSPKMVQEIINTINKEIKFKRFYYIGRRDNETYMFYITINDVEYNLEDLLKESLKQTIVVNFPGFAFDGDVLVEI